MESLNISKEFIFFRDDIICSEDHRIVQMSKDMLRVCGKALEKEGLLEDSEWFWKCSGLQDEVIKSF